MRADRKLLHYKLQQAEEELISLKQRFVLYLFLMLGMGILIGAFIPQLLTNT